MSDSVIRIGKAKVEVRTGKYRTAFAPKDNQSAANQIALLQSMLVERDARLAAAEADIDRLNQMLRTTGYGQGQIDSYAAECEARERAEERVAKAEAKFNALRQAVVPFEAVGRSLDPRLADHWCHHYDHVVGEYRELVAAIDASVEPTAS